MNNHLQRLNILKTYNVNTHQVRTKPSETAAREQAKLNALVETKAEEMMVTHLTKLKTQGPTM